MESLIFPDHQIIQNILLQDINIPYSELQTKVITKIKPIYNGIDTLLRNKLPFFPKMKISNYSKEPKRSRLWNTRVYWVYNNPKLGFKKELYLFIQLGDLRQIREKTIFWGISHWVGGDSEETDSAYHLFEKIKQVKVFKESGGVAGLASNGTTVFGIVNQYTVDQLLYLRADIKVEIAESIGRLFQEMEQIVGSVTSDNSFYSELYLPTKEDVEFAESQLRKFTDEVIGIEAVLDQVDSNFRKVLKSLKPSWREITRINIENWFGKKEG